MSERSAYQVSGNLIWDPRCDKYVFRIYTQGKYTDYELAAENIPITITTKRLALFDGDNPRLGWASDLPRKS